jgi:hypothetical protein
LAIDTQIPTAEGWTRMGSLIVGDTLFDERGLPCFVTGVSPASSHTSRTLRLTKHRAEWQVSWGFQDRPFDWPSPETAENRSPEANSLRTS